MTQYCGLTCAHCRHFIVLRAYEVEREGQLGADFRLAEPVMTFSCPACGKSCGYCQRDVAYSFSVDGAQARYPYREAASAS
jgi:hypothetical protein